MRVYRGLMALIVVAMFAGAVQAADPNAGVTGWVLAGPGAQEFRVGYEGLLPDIEVALGGRHLDAPDEGVEHWGLRAYVLAHALDTQIVATMIGNKIALPDGDIYGGIFGDYTLDRANEWSGGYVVGGLVAFPRGWETFVEYDATVFNTTDNAYQVMAGLRRRF
jgi:hypothetical protein